jgi:hypothetical protein
MPGVLPDCRTTTMRIWIMFFFLLLEVSCLGVGVGRMILNVDHAGRWLFAGVAAYVALFMLAHAR